MEVLPLGGLIGLILFAELAAVLGGWIVAPGVEKLAGSPTPPIETVSNTVALGRLMYTQDVYLFQACGIVLLVAMIGAIVLTLRHRVGVRKQDIGAQLASRRDEVVAIRKVTTGEGV